MSEDEYGTRALGPLRGRLREGAGQLRGRSRIASSALRRLSQAGRPAGIDVEMGDARLRLYPDENVTDKRAYMAQPILGEDVRATVRRLSTAAAGPFRFVDVGANTGLYSIRFAQVAREAGVVFEGLAIEAFPPTFARMRFNLEASGLLGEGANRVRAVPAAVSDVEGTVRLDTGFRDLGRVRIADDGGVEVPARRLSAIVAEAGLERVDLLKIDVEGHELAALAPFFASTPPEIWPKVILAETLAQADPLEPLLFARGYTIVARSKANAVFERHGA